MNVYLTRANERSQRVKNPCPVPGLGCRSTAEEINFHKETGDVLSSMGFDKRQEMYTHGLSQGDMSCSPWALTRYRRRSTVSHLSPSLLTVRYCWDVSVWKVQVHGRQINSEEDDLRYIWSWKYNDWCQKTSPRKREVDRDISQKILEQRDCLFLILSLWKLKSENGNFPNFLFLLLW